MMMKNMIRGGAFPEQLVEEILSRSTVKCILRCRCLSKTWNALISSPRFGRLIKRNRNRNQDDYGLTLLVEEATHEDYKRGRGYFNMAKKRYLWDEDEWRERENRNVDRFKFEYWDGETQEQSDMHISFSSHGLVVMHSRTCQNVPFSTEFIIFNPITRDKMKITAPENAPGQIYGVYFHPVLEEFCVLWGQGTPQTCGGSIGYSRPRYSEDTDLGAFNSLVEEYKWVNLGPSTPRWRKINNQTTSRILNRHQQPRMKSHTEGFNGGASPVIVHNVLYWMVDEEIQLFWGPNSQTCCEEAILAFDTLTQEFQLLPHPDPGRCDSKRNQEYGPEEIVEQHYEGMSLLEYDNHLSLLHISDDNYDNQRILFDLRIDIWMLKKERCWIKMHTINHVAHRRTPHVSDLKPIALINGETLVAHLIGTERLFVYNLRLGTRSVFTETRYGRDRLWEIFICAHECNFIRMRNSQPQILLT